MKLGDFRKILDAVEDFYRDAGNSAVSHALKEVSGLFDGRESTTLSAFAKLAGKAGPLFPDRTDWGQSNATLSVSQLGMRLEQVKKFCTAVGAKSAAIKDLQILSDILKPYSAMPTERFCAELQSCLTQIVAKPAARTRPKAPSSDAAIKQYLTDLRGAGNDREAFANVFARLKASKSVKLLDLSEIARQYSLSTTKYKSKAAAYEDIEKAFVRDARFRNKLE